MTVSVYHWDTFDNETTLVREFDNLPEAKLFVKKRYRIQSNGADRIDIVDKKGNVVKSYNIA